MSQTLQLAGYQMISSPAIFYPASHKPADIENFRPVYAEVSPSTLQGAGSVTPDTLIPASELTTCRHCGFRVKLNEPPQPEAPPSAFAEDPMDIVRTVACMADRLAEMSDEERENDPSPLAINSPLVIAARRACLERGFTAGGLAQNHDSDCALHNEPAYPAGPCDCRLSKKGSV